MKRNSGCTVELISIALQNEETELKEQFLLLGTRQPQTRTAELSLLLSHNLDNILSYRTSKKCKGQRSSFSRLEKKQTNKETVITTTKVKIYIHTKN